MVLWWRYTYCQSNSATWFGLLNQGPGQNISQVKYRKGLSSCEPIWAASYCSVSQTGRYTVFAFNLRPVSTGHYTVFAFNL